jgi:hypothetical protein
MADPKAAPLADDVKEYALYVCAPWTPPASADRRRTFPTAAFPKNFFCTLCSQLAIDSYKLLCCNKAICASCEFHPRRPPPPRPAPPCARVC